VRKDLSIAGGYTELLEQVDKVPSFEMKMWLMVDSIIEDESASRPLRVLGDLIKVIPFKVRDSEMTKEKLRNLLTSSLNDLEELLNLPDIDSGEMIERMHPFTGSIEKVFTEQLEREKRLRFVMAISEASLTGIGSVGDQSDLATLERYKSLGDEDLAYYAEQSSISILNRNEVGKTKKSRTASRGDRHYSDSDASRNKEGVGQYNLDQPESIEVDGGKAQNRFLWSIGAAFILGVFALFFKTFKGKST